MLKKKNCQHPSKAIITTQRTGDSCLCTWSHLWEGERYLLGNGLLPQIEMSCLVAVQARKEGLKLFCHCWRFSASWWTTSTRVCFQGRKELQECWWQLTHSISSRMLSWATTAHLRLNLYQQNPALPPTWKTCCAITRSQDHCSDIWKGQNEIFMYNMNSAPFTFHRKARCYIYKKSAEKLN